jgi:beta-mannosidase
MKKLIYSLLFLIASTNLIAAVPDSLTLNINWKFRQKGETWYPASVPGTVHTDLLANKLIEDPWFGNNEAGLQWIETKDWEYKCSFDCPRTITNRSHIELNFKGLDTYANVYLNDKLIMVANNMFREWTVDIKPFLKPVGNNLVISFNNPVTIGKLWQKKLPYTLPGDEKIFTRKAQYQYGWDWGPRFVTTGIWRPVVIRAWDDAVIDHVTILQQKQEKDLAKITCIIHLNTIVGGKYSLQLAGNPGDGYGKASDVELSPGMSSFRLDLEITNPKLWWCNGLGEPHLYTLFVSLLKDGRLTDRKVSRFGIRTIEILQEAGGRRQETGSNPLSTSPPPLGGGQEGAPGATANAAISGQLEVGKSFFVRLNGVPVYMKGANYIPPDNFMPRYNRSRYDSILSLAADANMNMLRVWGGGTYEDDSFYDLCDEKGILVWQDFMFACAMYPGDTAFLNNVKQEAISNVRRLQHHPSLALWCGNNEIDEGWHNWGWQKQYNYSAADSARIWGDYLKVFHEILPDVVKEDDPQRFYWPSSPSIGWGRKESLLSGDSHYWGVWWGMEPFETYEKKVGRFMSEYGFQGFPDPKTIASFTKAEDRVLNSPVLKAHQKHPTGYETIQTYMEREYNPPKDLLQYNYVSQLLQAGGVGRAIEAQRRAMPWCMGSLYWQLNDCWPVVSWSSADCYNRPKALHYKVKKLYEPVIISIYENQDNVEVWVISDELKAATRSLKLRLLDFTGKTLWQKSLDGISLKNESMKVFETGRAQLLKDYKAEEVLLVAEFEGTKTQNSVEALHYFSLPKNLRLPKPRFTNDIIAENGQTYLKLTAQSLVKNLYFYSESIDLNPEDNFIDLLPGKTYKIRLNPVNNGKTSLRLVKFLSLYEITK